MSLTTGIWNILVLQFDKKGEKNMKKFLISIFLCLIISFGTYAENAILTDLLNGNKRFVNDNIPSKQYGARKTELINGQKPPVIVLGCSDSRVPPEIIFDKGLGDIFVVRTAGNICDKIALGSIEYGAEHLHSQILIVLGHDKCGAVNATIESMNSNEKHSSGKEEENILSIVKMIESGIKDISKAWKNSDQYVDECINKNIQHTMEYIFHNSPVIVKLVKEGKLDVVGARYNFQNGQVDILFDESATKGYLQHFLNTSKSQIKHKSKTSNSENKESHKEEKSAHKKSHFEK